MDKLLLPGHNLNQHFNFRSGRAPTKGTVMLISKTVQLKVVCWDRPVENLASRCTLKVSNSKSAFQISYSTDRPKFCHKNLKMFEVRFNHRQWIKLDSASIFQNSPFWMFCTSKAGKLKSSRKWATSGCHDCNKQSYVIIRPASSFIYFLKGNKFSSEMFHSWKRESISKRFFGVNFLTLFCKLDRFITFFWSLWYGLDYKREQINYQISR